MNAVAEDPNHDSLLEIGLGPIHPGGLDRVTAVVNKAGYSVILIHPARGHGVEIAQVIDKRRRARNADSVSRDRYARRRRRVRGV